MKLLISAIEPSANIHLKTLINNLPSDIQITGIFDKEIGESIIDLQNIAVMGFVDAIKKINFFFRLLNQMVELSKDVDKVLLIDSSGFNLPLAKKIKKKYPNKEIIYYILPQAWAWKQKRIPILEKNIDHLCSILPFEKNYYSSNAPITYVGHPLLDIIPKYKENINKDIKHIAFMPGSRKSEIKKLMPIFSEVRKRLDIKSTLIIPKHFTKEEVKELYGNITDFEITNETHKTLYDVDFAFICSGTATLEAALIGTPFVLSYIAKPIDFFIVSKLTKLKYIGLSNIMFTQFNSKPLHPELLQKDVTVDNLINAFKTFDRKIFLENTKILRTYLKHGSSQKVASIIKE